ncbi:Positive regulator of CheA protein activity (CheW) [hydrothermal vent metagenome]|uniref:Positive regulator of CheA protein activity (CheW) n=1 Tax=hydrothermal vent metagenome TaxID=652676 RepID=A0A3B1DB89_9ZZZZ
MKIQTAIVETGRRKYLTFRLGGEEYGLEILKVREIIGVMKITSVPQTPKYLRGVINLRGKVVPVIYLRRQFGMEEIESTEKTCIIVIDRGNGGLCGLYVDAVSEVLDINYKEIEPTPDFGARIKTDFISGMAKVGDRVKTLLNISAVLSGLDISKAREGVKEQE